MNTQIHPTTIAAALPFPREEEQGQKGRKRRRKGREEGRDRREVREGDDERAQAPQRHLFISAAHVCASKHTGRVLPHMLRMVSL